MRLKRLFIISGCNGAGKTTASYTTLPELLVCDEFVNAAEIAKGYRRSIRNQPQFKRADSCLKE